MSFTLTPNALAGFYMFSNVMLVPPRSTVPMYVHGHQPRVPTFLVAIQVWCVNVAPLNRIHIGSHFLSSSVSLFLDAKVTSYTIFANTL